MSRDLKTPAVSHLVLFKSFDINFGLTIGRIEASREELTFRTIGMSYPSRYFEFEPMDVILSKPIPFVVGLTSGHVTLWLYLRKRDALYEQLKELGYPVK